MKKKIIFTIFLAIFFVALKNITANAVEIPKVHLEGDISNMVDKKDEREILLKYESESLNFEKYTKIKLQGSSSLSYDKKNYTINLYEDKDFNKKAKVDLGQGWGEHSKYNLKANWIDRTHSRNIVSARIAGKIQKKYGVLDGLANNGEIDGFPVEVYMNNEFLGLYTWNIPKDAWMWNMNEENSNHIVLEGEWYTEFTNFKKPLDGFEGTGWKEEVGKPNKETVSNFDRLVWFINNSSDEEFVRDFDLYLNRDSCLNYLVMTYLIEGIDNTGKNMMLVTYDNGKTWYLTLYDLDSTWGVWTDGTLMNSYEILPEDEISNHSTNNLFLRMIKCMPDEISNRWFSLRKNIFDKQNILDEFNEFTGGIPEEVYKKEEDKWGEIPGYGIKQIKDFLDFRIAYIDKIMYNRYSENGKKLYEIFNKIENMAEEIKLKRVIPGVFYFVLLM